MIRITHSIGADLIRRDIWQNLYNNNMAHLLSQHSCMAVKPGRSHIEWKMDAADKRMLRHIYGISYEDHVENTEISRQAGVKEMSSFKEKRRLQWHGHVCRRDEDEDICQVKNIQVCVRRKRGRPPKRRKDTVKSGMSRWGFERETTGQGPMTFSIWIWS